MSNYDFCSSQKSEVFDRDVKSTLERSIIISNMNLSLKTKDKRKVDGTKLHIPEITKKIEFK